MWKRKEIKWWVHLRVTSASPGQTVPQPLHPVSDLKKLSLERGLPVNLCSLRKGIINIKWRHKSLFFKRFNVWAERWKITTFPFLLGIWIFVNGQPEERRGRTSRRICHSLGLCDLFRELSTVLITSLHYHSFWRWHIISLNWQGA